MRNILELTWRHADESAKSVVLALGLFLPVCSPIMVASRSCYRGDVSIIKEGIHRVAVIAELDEPDNFSKTDLEDTRIDIR